MLATQKHIIKFCSPSLLWLLPICLIFIEVRLSEMAVARALIKAGSDFTYDQVPGRILVRRETKAHNKPQYLWAGQCGDVGGGWTTNGKDRIGNAVLEWETGKMIIRNFTSDDVGSYTFPLEEQRGGENWAVAKTLLIIDMDVNA